MLNWSKARVFEALPFLRQLWQKVKTPGSLETGKGSGGQQMRPVSIIGMVVVYPHQQLEDVKEASSQSSPSLVAPLSFLAFVGGKALSLL